MNNLQILIDMQKLPFYKRGIVNADGTINEIFSKQRHDYYTLEMQIIDSAKELKEGDKIFYIKKKYKRNIRKGEFLLSDEIKEVKKGVIIKSLYKIKEPIKRGGFVLIPKISIKASGNIIELNLNEICKR